MLPFNLFYSLRISVMYSHVCVCVFWQEFVIGLKEMHPFSHTLREESSSIDSKHLPFYLVSKLISSNAAHKQMHPYFIPFPLLYFHLRF